MTRHFMAIFIIFASITLFQSVYTNRALSADADTSLDMISCLTVQDVCFAGEGILASDVEKDPAQAGDYFSRKPDETGKIMVVAFHKFVDEFVPTKTDKGSFTTTFKDFRKLLQTLYDRGYRLINLGDFINNHISVPSGCIPIVFTFDDGSDGQFNLVRKDGKLTANELSAVGVLEEFNREHPDFGLKGTFYVNLGLDTFNGEGSLAERLKYLIDEGFEIGNHTLTHVNIRKESDLQKVIQEIGGSQKEMYRLVPGYKMFSFAPPYGLMPEKLDARIFNGEYDGTEYENRAFMKIAYDPMYSPVDICYHSHSFKRILASCMTPFHGDLAWWLDNLPLEQQYVSDGNPDTITVPKRSVPKVDVYKLNGKALFIYDSDGVYSQQYQRHTRIQRQGI